MNNNIIELNSKFYPGALVGTMDGDGTCVTDLGNVENCDCTDAENYDFYDEGRFFVVHKLCIKTLIPDNP